jgi:hypothetical protein
MMPRGGIHTPRERGCVLYLLLRVFEQNYMVTRYYYTVQGRFLSTCLSSY